MKSLSLKKLLITALISLCLSMHSEAQTMSVRYQMNPKVGQAVDKMRATHSDAELLQTLSTIQDPAEQATQVLLASMSVFDLAQRNEVLMMLFQHPADNGLNATHIPLLAELYVKAAQSPPFPLHLEQPRSVIKNEVLELRLLVIIASLLHAESPLATLKPEKPMPRLVRLFESTRGSSSLSAADHKMVEDVIIVVKQKMEDNGPKELAPTIATPFLNSSVGQPSAPRKPPAPKPTSSPPTSEPSSSTPWSIIIVLVLAALGLLWLLLRRQK